MTESWCIVAIPEEEDPVWKTSSEKIPHCTLLFLGEQDSAEKAIHITEQIQHMVSTSLTTFAMDVHSRGTLGEKSADVLFFDQARVPKDLIEFRSQLLKDDTIRECYDSADQYPSWTPHLTMGYPETPAKKDKDRYSDKFRMVYFDRIALWISDYDGPEVKLGYEKTFGGPRQRLSDWDSMADSSLAMSDSTRAFLMHGSQASVSNDIQQYIDASQRAFARHLEDVVPAKPSERANRKFDVSTHPTGDWLVSSINTASKEGTVESRITPITDEQGLIVDLEVAHTALTNDDIRHALMHWGIKGMKWGVRRKSSDSSSSSSASGGANGSGGAAGGAGGAGGAIKAKLQAKGAGKKQEVKEMLKRPVSEDAVDAAAKRSRTSQHGTDALSNKELKAMIQRMNLEQQYANLKENEKATKGRKSGRLYVGDMMKEVGNEMAKEALKTVATEALKYAFTQGKSATESRRANWVNSSPAMINPPRRQLAIGQ
jgi:2'-5' RNA ligase